jgi:hypothetical protein
MKKVNFLLNLKYLWEHLQIRYYDLREIQDGVFQFELFLQKPFQLVQAQLK